MNVGVTTVNDPPVLMPNCKLTEPALLGTRMPSTWQIHTWLADIEVRPMPPEALTPKLDKYVALDRLSVAENWPPEPPGAATLTAGVDAAPEVDRMHQA